MSALYDASERNRRPEFDRRVRMDDGTQTDSVREEVCQWLELHDIPPSTAVAVQDGPVTAVLVKDQRPDGSSFLNPRTDRLARHWVVVAPKWPLP